MFDAGQTWGLCISSVSGTTLTPVSVVTGIPTAVGMAPGDVGWLTFSLSGGDAVALSPNADYAFELYSSAGWFGIDATKATRPTRTAQASTAVPAIATSPTRRSAIWRTTVTIERSTLRCRPCLNPRRLFWG